MKESRDTELKIPEHKIADEVDAIIMEISDNLKNLDNIRNEPINWEEVKVGYIIFEIPVVFVYGADPECDDFCSEIERRFLEKHGKSIVVKAEG